LPDDNAMDVDKHFINMDVLDGVVMGAQVGVVLLILIIGVTNKLYCRFVLLITVKMNLPMLEVAHYVKCIKSSLQVAVWFKTV
jgi:hypothetical protein